MSIYASIEGIGDVGDPEHLGQPWVYAGSHITADARDDQPSDGPPWPWLRLHLDAPGNDPTVLLDPDQAEFLGEQMVTWAKSARGATR